MSTGRMPAFPASASEGFSSTPVKVSWEKDVHSSRGLDDGVLSDDEDTFSLLSPIYHDSFGSDEEDVQHSPARQTSPKQSVNSSCSVSPIRCELPKTPVRKTLGVLPSAASPTLSPWEMWLVNKAKEDRLKLEKKAEEERLLKEKTKQQEREQEQKKIVIEERIQDWLKMKREQEKHEQFVKQGKEEEEEIQRQLQKRRETEQKAQQKYKDWLQKKNQEKVQKEKKAKEEAALKEAQEKERRKMAEEKFKDWLTKANDKSRASPKSHCYPTSPYEKSYPSPSFYNPIPWKPIHVPPPETTLNNASNMKPQKQRKSQPIPTTGFRLRNTVRTAQLLHRR